MCFGCSFCLCLALLDNFQKDGRLKRNTFFSEIIFATKVSETFSFVLSTVSFQRKEETAGEHIICARLQGSFFQEERMASVLELRSISLFNIALWLRCLGIYMHSPL
mmetsp:Transcript_8749/g.32342  ORF Transcript_8749/g.32342 Transcript_8749/m.32342 type:complete len:107 (-) Transcript_8749:1389-1709(-)